MKIGSPEKISVLALVLLITGAIDSIRNLPVTALFGSSLIFFFIFGAIIFLIPVALVAAELSSTWPKEEGGVYSWVRHAFGENVAFFTIWLQWINTMVWYPTILLFIAGTAAYLVNPALADNKIYLVVFTLSVFWGLTGLGLVGLKASANFAGFCTIIGMIVPMVFIIGLAFVWFFKGQPLAIELNMHSIWPHWKNMQSWVSLTAVMTSFLGMELAAVHVRSVKNPQINFPKAMLYSCVLILLTMVFGSLSIAFVLPAEKINLVAGIMQAFTHFFAAYHLSFLVSPIIVLLLIGSLGGMVNWIISPAKGLLLAAKTGFLPEKLYRLNKHGVASRILIAQALLVTLLCGGFLLFPSVNAIYWLFTDLSTELYILMYVILFIAAWHLKKKHMTLPRAFHIPGGKLGYYLTCSLGLIGCLITLIVGFVPPDVNMNITEKGHFGILFASGIILLLLPALLLYWRKSLQQRRGT